MTNKITIIICIVLIFIFAYGFTLAYGEERFNDTVSILIPDNVTEQFKKCSLDQVNSQGMTFSCSWKFTFENGLEWHEALVEAQRLSHPVCDFGYNQDTMKCLDEIIILTVNPTPKITAPTIHERDLEILKNKIENNKELDSIEQEYYEMLLLIDECQRGKNQARGIQENSSFVTSELWKSTDPTAIGTIKDRDGRHAILANAIEECIAQSVFLSLVGDDRHPEDVRSKQSWWGALQEYHGNKAMYDKDFWSRIPVQSDHTITDHDMISEAKLAWDKMCEYDKISTNFKKLQDCPPIQYIESAKRSSGELPIHAFPLDRLTQYKLDNGEAMREQILYEKMLDAQRDTKR